MNMGTLTLTVNVFTKTNFVNDFDNSIAIQQNATVSFDTFIRDREAPEENRIGLQRRFRDLIRHLLSNNDNSWLVC